MNISYREITAGICLFSLIISFQNCSIKKNTIEDEQPTIHSFQNKKIDALEYVYSNDSNSPYYYQVSYKVDFNTKKLDLSVINTPGNTVTLPTASSKLLSDAQLSQISTLFYQIPAMRCSAGTPTATSTVEGIFLYTPQNPSPDSYIWILDCTGILANGQYQAQSADTQAFISYLKNL